MEALTSGLASLETERDFGDAPGLFVGEIGVGGRGGAEASLVEGATRHGTGYGVHDGAVGVGAGGAVARPVEVDKAGVYLLQRIVVDAEALGARRGGSCGRRRRPFSMMR